MKGPFIALVLVIVFGIAYLIWVGIVALVLWLLSLNGVHAHLNIWATAALCWLVTAVIGGIVRGNK